MDEGSIFVLATVLPLAIIAGGVLIIVLAMRQRGLTLEMRHRERMAMIERGLLTSPERSPAAFEAALDRHGRAEAPGRSTSLGILVVALGLGFMLLVAFAGDAPGAAVGIGGATMALGVALIVIGELKRRTGPPVAWTRQTPASSTPTSVPTEPPPPAGP